MSARIVGFYQLIQIHVKNIRLAWTCVFFLDKNATGELFVSPWLLFSVLAAKPDKISPWNCSPELAWAMKRLMGWRQQPSPVARWERASTFFAPCL